MSRRARINGLIDNVKDGEPQLFVGRIVSSTDGEYSAIINGRPEPMQGLAKNDFIFNGTGHEDGDEVLIVSAPGNDMPVIVAHSPWLLNMDGTEYSE